MRSIMLALVVIATIAGAARADCADGCQLPDGGRSITQAPPTESEA